jgi:ParB-like chromosome segregation protein Spo0J
MSELQNITNVVNPTGNDLPEQNVESADRLNTTQEVRMIVLEEIRLTDKYKFRVGDDERTIAVYAEIYRQFLNDSGIDKSVKCQFGAIHVLREDDAYYVIAGRHRFLAAKKAGMKEILCIVLTDNKEAIQIGLESNKHGLPLNNRDKAHCIRIAVLTFPDLSNRRIAEMIGCNSRYVDRIVEKEQLRTGTQLVKGKDGKTYKANKKRSKPAQQQEELANTSSDTVPSVAEAEPVATEQIAMSRSTVRSFDQLKAALESVPTDERARVRVYVDIVKTIIAEGFTDDNYRQDFLQQLRSEIIDFH